MRRVGARRRTPAVPLPRPSLVPPASPLERLPEEWADVLAAWGEPRFRALQVFRWIHQRGVLDPSAMSDLPKTLRARLGEEGLTPPATIAGVGRSSDGTRKLLVRLAGDKDVETVLIPQGAAADESEPEEGDDEPVATPARPVTQCISTQVGCAMGCVFCASGVAGLKRHMTAGEIVSQLLLGRAHLDADERLRNVVLMGMGEPLHNYDAVARALVLATHADGLALSTRRVTLSTSGLVPQIDRLGREFAGQVQLAVSLHAVDDRKRSLLMPINRKHPLAELMDALRRYPLPKRRRITIEYTLVAGQNDDPNDADALADLLRGIPVKVNLIPMNPISASTLGPPSDPRVDEFQARLRARHVTALVRKRRGDDIDAACGQLALHGEKRKVRAGLGGL